MFACIGAILVHPHFLTQHQKFLPLLVLQVLPQLSRLSLLAPDSSCHLSVLHRAQPAEGPVSLHRIVCHRGQVQRPVVRAGEVQHQL